MVPAIPAGAAAASSAPAPTATPGVPRFHASRFVTAILLFVSGVLSAVSTAVSWWTINQTGTNPATIYFLPGSSLRGSSGSASVTATYAAAQLGPVGGLYDAILAIAIAVACLAVIAGVLVLLSSLGRVRNPARYSTFRGLIVAVLVVCLFLVIVVPTTQGAVIRQSGGTGSGLCTLDNSSTNPCTAFWGSSSASGNSVTWGADAGWYLLLAATVLVAVGLYLGRSTLSASGSGPIPPVAAAAYPPFALASVPSQDSPVDKLLRAKALADAGLISPAEFEELRTRLVGQLSTTEGASSLTLGTRPEDDLGKLKVLHDSGAISDSEYAELRKKVLIRF